jgi:hypothetical protein
MWSYAGSSMAVPIYWRDAFEFSLLPTHTFCVQNYEVIYILLGDKILLPSLAGIQVPSSKEDYIGSTYVRTVTVSGKRWGT